MPTGYKTRSRDETASSYVKLINNDDNSYVVYQNGSSGKSSFIREHCVANWREIVKSGSICTNELERLIESRTAGTAQLTETIPEFGKNWSVVGDVAAFVETSPYSNRPSLLGDQGTTTLVKNLAFTAANAKASEGTMELGTSFGELAETIRMLKNPFGKVTSLLANMAESRKRRRGKKRRGQIPTETELTRDVWLEYRYGWKPLMKEIESVMSACAAALKAHAARGRRVYRHTEVRETKSSNDFSMVPLSGALGGMKVDGRYTCTQKYRGSAGVIVDLVVISEADLILKIFGFRCRDIPSTIWSLTPFSFVGDWFVNVGEWLQAVIPDPTYVVRGTWLTDVTDISVLTEAGILYAPQIGSRPPTQGYYGPSLSKRVTINRTPNYQVPTTPLLRFKPLNVIQTADAMALGHGQIMSRLSTFAH